MSRTRKINARKPPAEASGPGTLYVVATPIGNLEDITLRALRVLQEVSLIAAEDTRHTRKLLSHFNISTPTIGYYKEKEQERTNLIVKKLQAGLHVALVSDAGTPAISDPGSILVRRALADNIRVEPIPGPSSLTAALSVAGLADNTFIFLGFAPSRKKERRDLLLSVSREKRYLAFFEAPHRLRSFLSDCCDILGNRPAVWCRELTKIHEEITRDSLSVLLTQCEAGKIRGESVIIIAGAEPGPQIAATELAALLRTYKDAGEKSLRDAVQSISIEFGLARSDVYKQALRIWQKN